MDIMSLKPEHKQCTKCKKEKPLEDFSWKNKEKGRFNLETEHNL